MASFLNRYPHKQSKEEEEKLKGREREKEKKRGIYEAPNQHPINQPSRKIKGKQNGKEIACPGGLF
jgi:hypothetical protein